VTPHIYRRFDIVWPDSSTAEDAEPGVDALTHGLSTLVMSKQIFQREPVSITPRGTIRLDTSGYTKPRPRRGNDYAHYVRFFSLGDGPREFIEDYLPTKESGKMLGTLVALAVARMINLQSFIWDMPTGIVSDIWTALASLGDFDVPQDCVLEHVHIRWHNNSKLPGNKSPPSSPTPDPNSFPEAVNATADDAAKLGAHVNRVERPTFSMLPPVTNLAVLNIDELAYLDEMSILIGRSSHRLRKLRVGLAKHASGADWTGAWRSEELQQLPSSSADSLKGTSMYERRLGGPLGVLVAHVCDMKSDSALERQQKDRDRLKTTGPVCKESPPITKLIISDAEKVPATPDVFGPVHNPASRMVKDTEPVAGFLNIEVIELERVPISAAVLSTAFDLTRLTDVVVYSCPDHEHLWQLLQSKYSPGSIKTPEFSLTDHSLLKTTSRLAHSFERSEYSLNIKKIATDAVSQQLLTFVSNALPRDSLEAVFLQQTKYYSSKITMASIFSTFVKRHRASLRYLSLDSSHRDPKSSMHNNERKQWAVNREHITFLTSGKMPRLRELAIVLEFKDWHYFLQGLPRLTTLRSLHILHILKDGLPSSDATAQDARQLALQILDVAILCPGVRLTYIAIREHCFEIIEAAWNDNGDEWASVESSSTHSDGEDDGEDPVNDSQGVVVATIPWNHPPSNASAEPEDGPDGFPDDSDGSDMTDDLADRGPRLKLREILFFDDKVKIFEARHGRL